MPSGARVAGERFNVTPEIVRGDNLKTERKDFAGSKAI